ncbi:MAG: TerB family tellurite resistance protein [Polyangiaceae bacterium]
MIWLSTSTVARLRDQLQTRGQRPSIALTGDPPKMTPDAAELLTVTAEFGPICEAMYLMMSADGSIGDVERDVLRGAIKNLSQDSVRTPHIDAMLEQSAKLVAEQGRDARLKEVVASLQDDPARGEVAFVLAAAIAFADNAIADEENETLNLFAEGLGIDEARAEQLLDSVEKDLAQR